ncbi:hypothetical protein [Nocardioides immobilis]|uniref:hypothetical protein n=1 Tax=Nocardioides immobilis TaxID=2049295 RepID=UPI0011C49001|nr:hypothetical protein [Nocardioides immobilis]
MGYTHRPGDLADEVVKAGLHLDDLVGVEGLPLAATDMQSRIGEPAAWDVLSTRHEPSNGFQSRWVSARA